MFSASASAADLVNVRGRNLQRINQTYGATASSSNAARSTIQRHAEMLALEPGAALELINSSQDQVGRHYRYQQTFLGVPLYGVQVVISEQPNGDIRALFGRLAVGVSGDVAKKSARISPAEAMSIAKRAGLGNNFGRMQTGAESIRKMIFIDESKRAHLVYVASFFADVPKGGKAILPMVIVDANTGRIHKQSDDLRR